mmetsp:Transcript_1726/g.3047  ORF Transcript_1726/g.3047 Transcript_1726/m.3047 type:complete len:179 (+) Transcript_1726:738-1274(+)
MKLLTPPFRSTVETCKDWLFESSFQLLLSLFLCTAPLESSNTSVCSLSSKTRLRFLPERSNNCSDRSPPSPPDGCVCASGDIGVKSADRPNFWSTSKTCSDDSKLRTEGCLITEGTNERHRVATAYRTVAALSWAAIDKRLDVRLDKVGEAAHMPEESSWSKGPDTIQWERAAGCSRP